MSEQSDLAGRLVETAAQTMWTAPLDELHVEDQDVARAVARDFLAAVLPLLADAIEAQERLPYAMQRYVRAADAVLLRDLAAEVAR